MPVEINRDRETGCRNSNPSRKEDSMKILRSEGSSFYNSLGKTANLFMLPNVGWSLVLEVLDAPILFSTGGPEFVSI